MAIPHKLRLFSCFVNGDNYLGKVTSFTRPKLSRKIEDYQGGGMLGAVGVDLGLEAGALDSTIVFGGVIKALFLEYGAEIDGTRLRFAGEYFTDGESQLVEVELRGRFTELDGGDSKQGEDTEESYTFKSTYYKFSIDDQPIIEIDLLNFIYKKNGQNMFPDRIPSALGMGN